MKNNYYCYYQPNKLDVKDEYGDCTIRSLSKALDIDWKEAFNLIVPYELKYQCPFPCMTLTLYKKVFKEIGFNYCKISNKKGSTRPTVNSFTKTHKTGTYILSLAGHLVCVKDGKFYDTQDCGSKCLYGYYEMEENDG